MARTTDREGLRADNIGRAEYLDSGGDPARAVEMWPELYRRPKGEAPYLYPVPGEHASLDEQLLGDLLRRVRNLERQVAGQHEVLRDLATWRTSFSQRAPQRGGPPEAPPQKHRPAPVERPAPAPKRGFTDG